MCCLFAVFPFRLMVPAHVTSTDCILLSYFLVSVQALMLAQSVEYKIHP